MPGRVWSAGDAVVLLCRDGVVGTGKEGHGGVRTGLDQGCEGHAALHLQGTSATTGLVCCRDGLQGSRREART